jgi:hypothetical protein
MNWLGEVGLKVQFLFYNKLIEGPRMEKKPFSVSKVWTVHERKFPFQYEVGMIWECSPPLAHLYR